jgi:hypothetical protein
MRRLVACHPLSLLAQFQLPAEDGEQRGTCHILVAKHASEKPLSQYLAPNDYQVGILWIAGAADLVAANGIGILAGWFHAICD